LSGCPGALTPPPFPRERDTQLFFGLRNPLLGLADILPLTATTYALAGKAYKVDPRTAFVFVPYCAWLSYATYLNGALTPSLLPLELVSSPCFGKLTLHNGHTAGIWWLNGGEAKIKKAKQDAKKDL